MKFPELRMRRLRRTPTWRRLVRENRLTVDDLISPLFVCPGEGVDRPIGSMPGCSQLSVDRLVEECRELFDLGIGAVILFGIPESKDARGSSSWSEEGIVQQALRSLKEALPDLVLVADVCFCEYTDHGHCGVLEGDDVANDPTLEITVRQALSLADAGADCLAPSGMMDGVVNAIRFALDDSGFEQIPILSYAAKYASAFYGPFREAAGSAPSFGDRRSYQMDAANVEEALREVALDLEEGADLVMVKPAMAFLDVVTRVKEVFEVPVAAYNVSGEYAMVKAAAEKGWIDEVQVRDELLVSMKRAGADLILTYFAKDVARSFRGGSA